MTETKFTPEATKVIKFRNSRYILATCPHCGYEQYETKRRHFTQCCNEDCGKEYIVEGN